MNARQLKKLSPEERFEAYKDKFWKKVDKFITPQKHEPKGNGECTKFGATTAKGTFSRAKIAGKSLHSRRVNVEKATKKKRILWHLINGFIQSGGMDEIAGDEYSRKCIGRAFGTIIFDIPHKYIGWESKAYIEAKEKDKSLDPTVEHIYPRQFDGEFIVEHMNTMGEISYEMMAQYLDVFTQTARVLPEENSRLEKYQKSHLFVQPELSYMAAGVDVILTDPDSTILRLEEVAPVEVIDAFFGSREQN